MSNELFSEYADLVRRYKAGDEDAFTSIYEKSSKFVYMTCLSVLGNSEDAEEAMQETYLAVFKDIDSLSDENMLIGWIKRIAAFKSYDILRKRKGNVSFDDAISVDDVLGRDDDLESLPDYYINEKAKRNELHKIIKRELSDVQYQMILFYYFNEMSVRDIASLMDCPEGTVKTRLKAARVKIKAAVEKYEKENNDKLAAVMGVPFLARFFKEEAMELSVPDMASVLKAQEKAPAGDKEGSAPSSKSGSGAKPAKGGSAPSGAKPGFLATAGGKITLVAGALAILVAGGLVIKYITDKPEDKDIDEDEEIEEVEEVETSVFETEPAETDEHEDQDTPSSEESSIFSLPSETTEETVLDPYSAADTGWSDAYADVVANIDINEVPAYYRESVMYSEDILCSLVYINEDEIPELVVSYENSYNEYFISVYSFVDGEAVEFGDFGRKVNMVSYVPGENLINGGGSSEFLNSVSSAVHTHCIYSMTDDCTEMSYIPFYNSNYDLNDLSTVDNATPDGYDYYFTKDEDGNYIQLSEEEYHLRSYSDYDFVELLGEYEVAEFLSLLPGDYSDIEVPDQYEVASSSSSGSSAPVAADDVMPA